MLPAWFKLIWILPTQLCAILRSQEKSTLIDLMYLIPFFLSLFFLASNSPHVNDQDAGGGEVMEKNQLHVTQ